MPKARKTSQPRRTSPYPTRLSSKAPPPPPPPPPPPQNPPPNKDTKEWDEARCPICLDHPHNAVLLVCKSTTKGCIPYICNTGKRHSNCLTLFKKMPKQSCEQTGKSYYPCPLCRGEVTNQIIVKNARDYLNGKVRSCSKESCSFSGTYRELRKHAMEDHPTVCPSEPDPERQSEWRSMEQRSDLGDLISTLRSSSAGYDGTGFTGVVRVPSMSLVLIVRVDPSPTVIANDDDYDSEVNIIDNDDDVSNEYDEASDEDYVFGNSRVRRSRSRTIMSDVEIDGDDDASDDDYYGFGNSRVRRRSGSRVIISDDEIDDAGDNYEEASDEDCYAFGNSRVRRRSRSQMIVSDDEMDGGDGP